MLSIIKSHLEYSNSFNLINKTPLFIRVDSDPKNILIKSYDKIYYSLKIPSLNNEWAEDGHGSSISIIYQDLKDSLYITVINKNIKYTYKYDSLGLR